HRDRRGAAPARLHEPAPARGLGAVRARHAPHHTDAEPGRARRVRVPRRGPRRALLRRRRRAAPARAAARGPRAARPACSSAAAPQPPELMREIRERLGAPDLAALSHNSFDQPALLGLPSLKPADHAPEAAVRSARLLGAGTVMPGASGMRWCGPRGPEITRRIIRRSGADFLARLAREAPEVPGVALAPGDAWSRAGGAERGVLRGTPEPPAATDYVHRLLDTGARHCPPGRPSTEDTVRRDLPALLARHPERAAYVGQAVAFEIVGAVPAVFTVDVAAPARPPVAGDAGAAFAL